MKTRQDNNMTDWIGTIYVENDSDLSWPIWLGAVCNEKLERMITWPIVQEQFTPKMIMNCHDWLKWVHFVTKTKEDNDVTNHTGAVYVENDTKISWLIELGVNSYDKKIGQLCDWWYRWDIS